MSGGGAETWGSPVRAEDTELGTLSTDILFMLAQYLRAGKGLRVEWEEGRKKKPFCGSQRFSSGHTYSPFEKPKGCRPSLLKKLPNIYGAEHGSQASHLLPSVLSKASFETMLSPREILVPAIFLAPVFLVKHQGL